ncbi:hypothetical protein KIW84_066439 [Lathyrus oleraceus]|uniref:Uncharacterized protein n=1 Tax=Pisum sativum TaxID=3888 RepID=A0A9D5ABK4_PEA|nr:hypothetical protein KIW84_066439 [Pisum sativum]
MIPYSIITTSFPNSVKTLNETNYEDWKESLDLYLAIVNLDLDMRTEKSSAIIDASTEAHMTLYEKWEYSNRLCLKGFTSLRNPSDIEEKVIMGDGARVPVMKI